MRRFRSSGYRDARAFAALALTLGLASTPRAASGQSRPDEPIGVPATLAAELDAASSECCLMLLYPIGARRASLSEAVTSIGSADAVFYNPAGLALLDRNHFVLHHVASSAQQADPMPTRLRVGVSYDVMHHIDADGEYQLWLLVDAEENDWKRPTTPTPSVALEFAVGEVVFLRGGYGGGEGITSGPAVGVGIVYSSFNVSVAKRVASGGLGDDPFQLTLDVVF